MPRNLDSNLAAQLSAPLIMPVIFASLQFNNGTMNAWTGVGPFTWGGNTFQGVGNFGQMSAVTEGSTVEAEGVTIQLLGIPLNTLSSNGGGGGGGNISPSFIQSIGSGSGGVLIGPAITQAFANDVTAGSSLIGYFGTSGTCQNIAITDSQSNDWVNLNETGGYVMGYTTASASGNNAVTGTLSGDGCGLAYDPCALLAEVGSAWGTPTVSAFSGANSVPYASVMVDEHLYEFAAVTSYSVWNLDIFTYSVGGPTAFLVAMLCTPETFTSDTISGWTEGPFNVLGAIYTCNTGNSNVPIIDVSTILNEVQMGAPATIWLGLLNNGQLIGTPYQIFKGMVDQPTVDVSTQTISISLDLENRLTNLQRGNGRRYTAADQNLLYPDDTGFNWVEMLNDIALRWGS